MNKNFDIPQGMIGRFAIVKLWPGIQTAEDECIARIKLAAQNSGIECIEVDADGNIFPGLSKRIDASYVDFVIHLHFDTPKNYDAFSIVALWNPIQFYHEWDYSRTTRNLLSHDDFISCDSLAADDHIIRLIGAGSVHLSPAFRMYHSLPQLFNKPTVGDLKIIYAGINWDALRGGKSRHQEVLDFLDKSGVLRIYGPRIFQGVNVWGGYDSYVSEVPFDGVSMVREITKAGIGLVLSSAAHKESGLMSNRLFESIAAGAVVICDENPFARRHFGDSLLYIDGRCSGGEIYSSIMRHYNWISENTDQALAMVKRTQEIFEEKFNLTENIRSIYRGLPERKKLLNERRCPKNTQPHNVSLSYLLPQFDKDILNRQINSIEIQDYPSIEAIIYIDAGFNQADKDYIYSRKNQILNNFEVIEIEFYETTLNPTPKISRRLGDIIHDIISASPGAHSFIFVAPNEVIFRDHVTTLVGALLSDPDTNVAATAALISDGNETIKRVNDLIDFGFFNKTHPTGFGRFIFRKSAIDNRCGAALRHLHARPLAALVGNHRIKQLMPATITINPGMIFPNSGANEVHENAIINDYSPMSLRVLDGRGEVLRKEQIIINQVMRNSEIFSRILSLNWLVHQFHLLRMHGFNSRFKAMCLKVRRLLL